ncbi:hypothetical protein Fmac_032009 [Flemingia macrophylla]|uniref:EF-hand domain-containing protein n=1 Tax=Flemingia macrophylla TaxID=520843 RepID=A0ABD1L3N1_9FABA
MSKAVVYILIATAMLFFFIFLSPLNLKEPREGGGGLNRRFGFKLLERTPNFDPLVTNIEKKTTYHDHQPPLFNHVDSTTAVSDVAETYQYLTSGGALNTTLRLIILFPLLDREPKDGVVGFNELEAWITQRAIERLDYLTQAELDSKDRNGDLVISFKEYLPQFSEKDIEKKEMGHGEAGWWMERFEVADTDKNGLLNFTELRERMDDENDGKLNFNEFEDHVFRTYESYMDFETNGGNVPSPKDKYAELDADDNGDGKLTLQEMLDHEFTFYNTVHADGHQESDDDHDEL